MADERLEFLLSIGLDDATAKRAVSGIDAMQKGLKDAEKRADEAKKKLQQLAEQGEKLASVGTRVAALGATILAPLTLAANAYTEKYKGVEKQATAFAASQERSANATTRLGRQAATALLPTLERVASITEKIATFVERNPEFLNAAVNVGGALAAGGGALAAIGTAQNVIGKLGQLLQGGGFATGAANAAIAVGALAVGAKGAEVLINKLGEASGNTYMENFKLADALKTVREILGGTALVIAKSFVEAKVAIGRLADIISGIAGTIGIKIEAAMLRLRSGIAEFVNGILEFAAGLANQLGQNELANSLRKSQDQQASRGNRLDKKTAYEAQADELEQTKLKALGDQLSRNETERMKQYDIDQQNLANFANDIAKFAESGSLGEAADSIVKAVGDGVSDLLTGSGGSSSGKGVFSREAVQAFIDFQQKQKDLAKQHSDQLLQMDAADKKARGEALKQENDINQKFMESELKDTTDFLEAEQKEQKRANKERLRLLRDLNDNLYDAASRNDVVAFLNAQRTAEKQLNQQEEDQDEAAKERQADFVKRRNEARIQRDKELNDLRDKFRDEQRERDVQRRILLEKQNEERRMLLFGFAQQLADLQGNIAGLSSIQNSYYAQSAQAMAQWVAANQTELQKLFGSTFNVSIPASSGGGSSGTPVYDSRRANNPILRSGRAIEAYASGTDFVPRDMLAFIHRGERIVPASQNKPGAGGVTVDMRGSYLTGGATQQDLTNIANAVIKGVATVLHPGGAS